VQQGGCGRLFSCAALLFSGMVDLAIVAKKMTWFHPKNII
jgi:hypothetical protein